MPQNNLETMFQLICIHFLMKIDVELRGEIQKDNDELILQNLLSCIKKYLNETFHISEKSSQNTEGL